MVEFNIESFRGFLREVAEKIDNRGDKNGKINGNEVSIFQFEATKLRAVGKISATEYVSLFDAVEETEEASIEIPQTDNNLQPVQPFNIKSDMQTNYNWNEEEFSKIYDNMLNNPRYKGKFKKSVLQGKAKAFIDIGREYNIDPRILVAIAMHESGRGMSSIAQNKNNIGGLGGPGHWINYNSVEDSIRAIAKKLQNCYQKGLTTPEKVAYSGSYCAKGAGSNWGKEVSSYLNHFKNYENII